MKGKPEGRGTCGIQSKKRPEFSFQGLGVEFLDCWYMTFSPSIQQNMFEGSEYVTSETWCFKFACGL